MPPPMPGRRPPANRGVKLTAGIAFLAYAAALTGAVLLIRRGDPVPSQGAQREVTTPTLPRAEVRDGALFRSGERFVVKAVGWDREHTGETWFESADPERAERDFERIRAAGFNTIRTWWPLPPAELVAAERQGLAVLLGLGVDPAGAFSNPGFVAAQRDHVRQVVRASRASRAILAYVIMNEPSPQHVLAQGLRPTRDLIEDLAATIREDDPGALVCFAGWPRLELLDEPALDLDLAAVNLYPVWPRHIIDAIGYAGLVRLQKHLAGERPFLVTEFGVPVAPGFAVSRWGVSEQEQARALPELADAVMRSGAAGGAVFSWLDGWWKQNDYPGDALVHDPDDVEEWFGLNAQTSLDGEERPRPALGAMRAWNRAVVTQPVDGARVSGTIPFEAYVENGNSPTVTVAIGDQPAVALPVTREGDWIRGDWPLSPSGPGPLRLTFSIAEGDSPLARVERVVLPEEHAPKITLRFEGSGTRAEVIAQVVDGRGTPLANAELRVVTLGATPRFDRSFKLRADDAGEARCTIELPTEPETLLVVAALRDGEEGPLLTLAAERAAATSAEAAEAAANDAPSESAHPQRTPARLEPNEGFHFGITLTDAETNLDVERRLGLRPAAFVLEPPLPFPMEHRDRFRLQRFLAQCAVSGQLAVVRLQPTQGLERVTAETCADLARLCAAYEGRGADIMLSFADEMNAPEHPWGNQPGRFKERFRLLAEHVHEQTKRAALLWAPAYLGLTPRQGGAAPRPDAGDLAALDTNGDGEVTPADDPYAPFYPGDEAVDWVGLRIAHWGNRRPFGDNHVPERDCLEDRVRGRYQGALGDERVLPDFLSRFVTDGVHQKPMAILGTSALYNPGGAGALEQEIKLAWLKQALEGPGKLPGLKLVSWLDVKREEPAAVGQMIDWRISHAEALKGELRHLISTAEADQ